MAFDPDNAPSLDDFNGGKKLDALLAAGHVPNGIKCPQSGDVAHELLDIPGTETKATNGLSLPTIKVLCPIHGPKGERYL